MARVFYIHSDGERSELDVDTGANLMMAATTQGVKGIQGDCGGVMSCATCHVIVEPEFAGLLPAPGDNESQMLEYTAAPREANSRLACQILMSPALDGITVRVADPQI